MANLKELFATSKKNELSADWWVLTDALSKEEVAVITAAEPRLPKSVKVFIDHDTPCGSVESAEVQKALIAYAIKYGCELFNGYGIACRIMTERFVHENDVVACMSEFPTVYGAVNALGVSLSAQAMAASIKSGTVIFEATEICGLKLSSPAVCPVSAKDIALAAADRAGNSLCGKAVVIYGVGEKVLGAAERFTLAQLMAVTGAVAVHFDDGFEGVIALTLDCSALRPLVAGPHSAKVVAEARTLNKTHLNEVFIGGCSGGSLEDLRLAAAMLKGQHIPVRLRLMIAPDSTEVYCQAANEGLLEIFADAGAIIMNQGCSVCWGKSQGIIDTDEVLLSTGSRNQKGCCGVETASVYLCSPATAAASAIKGYITEPEVFM